jgi:hypothetical protein
MRNTGVHKCEIGLVCGIILLIKYILKYSHMSGNPDKQNYTYTGTIKISSSGM